MARLLSTFTVLFLLCDYPPTPFAQKADPQSLLQIGDRKLKTSRIRPGVESFILYRISKGVRQSPIFLTRNVRIERRNEVETIVVEQQYDSASGVSTDVSVMLRQTLSPLTYSSKLATQTESFQFAATSVRGTITTNSGEIRRVEEPLRGPVFNAVVQDEIIASLALGKDRSYRFRSYNPGKQFLDITVRVIGTEVLQSVAGDINTWLIALEGAAVPTKIWVTKSSQKLIQQKSDLPNGDVFWRTRLF